MIHFHTLLAALLSALLLNGGQALAQNPSQTPPAFKLSGYAKVMYVADDKKGGRPNQGTPGVGGKLGVESGELLPGMTFKAAYYTTRDLGLRSDNPRETDAYMFDLDKTPYSLLGEAQVQFAHGPTRVIAGRQEFFSPIVNTYDYRIIPNLFEGVTLIHRAPADTTLTLAYLGKMSGLDGLVSYARFHSMAQQAYTSLLVTAAGRVDARNGETLDISRITGERGVWVAGAVREGPTRLQLWNFYGRDVLNTVYLDGQIKRPLPGQLATTLEAQAYRVAAVGEFKRFLALQGLNASYALFGLKGSLSHPPSGASVALAVNRFTGNENTVTAAGNWGGYPEYVSMPYLFAEQDSVSAIARSRLAKLTARLDLGAIGLGLGLAGHSLLFGHARIHPDENILANSFIRVNSLLYRAQLTPPLAARVALESRHSANTRYDNEFLTLSLRYDF